jgi:hypothetical protein
VSLFYTSGERFFLGNMGRWILGIAQPIALLVFIITEATLLAYIQYSYIYTVL